MTRVNSPCHPQQLSASSARHIDIQPTACLGGAPTATMSLPAKQLRRAAGSSATSASISFAPLGKTGGNMPLVAFCFGGCGDGIGEPLQAGHVQRVSTDWPSAQR